MGCNSSAPPSPGEPAASQPFASAGQLPGLPPAGAGSKAVTDLDYTFVATDAYAEKGAAWEGSDLNLAGPGLSYSVVGRNVSRVKPQSIVISGEVNGVWIALSNYGHERWTWLGQFFAPQEIPLPFGVLTSSEGMMYIALVCPDGSDATLATTLCPGPDMVPPVWVDGVGIISADVKPNRVSLSWNPAADADSPPIEYLVYCRGTSVGIDWDDPQLTVADGYTQTSFLISGHSATPFEVAVRARDAAGNVTTNTNIVTVDPNPQYILPIVPWEPGDWIVMQSPMPELDIMLYLRYEGIGEHLSGSTNYAGELTGLIDFSPDNLSLGYCREWVRLLESAPPGGYWITPAISAGHKQSVTLHFWLYDENDQLKYEFETMTYDAEMGGPFGLAVLAAGSWPRDLDWVPGDRFVFSWPDPNADLRLNIHSPSGGFGGPGFGGLLEDEIEFSPDSKDSGEGLEWARLLPGGWPGMYRASLNWDYYAGDPPESMMVSMQLLDGIDAVKADLGTLDLPAFGEVTLIAQLHYTPE